MAITSEESSAASFKDGPFYIRRIKDLPSSYLDRIRQLQQQVSDSRMFLLSFAELCTRLELDYLQLTRRQLTDKGPALFSEINALLEKFGLKIALCNAPAVLSPEDALPVCLKPELQNDEDVSYVQSIIESKKTITNRDLVIINRMKAKLANYNILLRVFEGLSAFSVRMLNHLQLAFLNNLTLQLELPSEGQRYLTSCYSYLCSYPAFASDFALPEYYLKALPDAAQEKTIVRYLTEIAVRSATPVTFDPRYLRSRQLRRELNVAALHPELHSPVYAGSLTGSDNHALHKERSRTFSVLNELLIQKVNMASDMLEAGSARFSVASRPLLQQQVTAALACSKLSPAEQQSMLLIFSQPDLALLKVLPADICQYPFVQTPDENTPVGVDLHCSMGLLGVICEDPAAARYWPFMICGSDLLYEKSRADNPLLSPFFKAPFTLLKNGRAVKRPPSGSLFYPALEQIAACYLLYRNLLCAADSTKDSDMLLECIGQALLHNPQTVTPLLLEIAGLYFYLFKFTGEETSLPPFLFPLLLQCPQIRTLLVWRLLQNPERELSQLPVCQKQILCPYIFQLARQAAGAEFDNLAGIDFTDPAVVRICSEVFDREVFSTYRTAGELFACISGSTDRKVQMTGPEVSLLRAAPQLLLAEHKFMPSDDFLIRLLSRLEKCHSRFGTCGCFVLQDTSFARRLCLSIKELFPLLKYMPQARQVFTPAELQKLVSSPAGAAAVLRRYFPTSGTTVLSLQMHLKVRDSHELQALLNCAGLFCVPVLHDFSFRTLQTLAKQLLFLPLPELGVTERREFFSRLLSAQAALHFYSCMSLCSEDLQSSARSLSELIAPDNQALQQLSLQFLEKLSDCLHYRAARSMKSLVSAYQQAGADIYAQAIEWLMYLLSSIHTLIQQRFMLFKDFQQLMSMLQLKADAPCLEPWPQLRCLFGVRSFNSFSAAAARRAARQNKASQTGLAGKDQEKQGDPAPVTFTRLNTALIASKLQESQEVQSVIGQLREENELSEELESAAAAPAQAAGLTAQKLQASQAGSAVQAASANTAETAKTAEATAAAEQEEDNAPDKPSLLSQLNPQAIPLLQALAGESREVIDAREFKGLCLSARFMSDSVAIEMLNDFALEHFDEMLLENAPEENCVYVSLDILQQLME